jgi:hypothetical protein
VSAPARTLAFAVVLMLPAARACAEPDALFPPATAGCYVGAESTVAAAGVPPHRKPAVPVTAVRRRSYSGRRCSRNGEPAMQSAGLPDVARRRKSRKLSGSRPVLAVKSLKT